MSSLPMQYFEVSLKNVKSYYVINQSRVVENFYKQNSNDNIQEIWVIVLATAWTSQDFLNVSPSMIPIYVRSISRILAFLSLTHYVKNVCIWSFSIRYFSAFGLNIERYGVSLLTQSDWAEIRTRKTPITDNFDTAPINLLIQHISQSCLL